LIPTIEALADAFAEVERRRQRVTYVGVSRPMYYVIRASGVFDIPTEELWGAFVDIVDGIQVDYVLQYEWLDSEPTAWTRILNDYLPD
jgi:hypothetical protein